MNPEVSLKSPKEIGGGLIIWDWSWVGNSGRRKPDQSLEKQNRTKRGPDGLQDILGVSWIGLNCWTELGLVERKQRYGKTDRWQK